MKAGLSHTPLEPFEIETFFKSCDRMDRLDCVNLTLPVYSYCSHTSIQKHDLAVMKSTPVNFYGFMQFRAHH